MSSSKANKSAERKKKQAEQLLKEAERDLQQAEGPTGIELLATTALRVTDIRNHDGAIVTRQGWNNVKAAAEQRGIIDRTADLSTTIISTSVNQMLKKLCARNKFPDGETMSAIFGLGRARGLVGMDADVVAPELSVKFGDRSREEVPPPALCPRSVGSVAPLARRRPAAPAAAAATCMVTSAHARGTACLQLVIQAHAQGHTARASAPHRRGQAR